MAKLIASLWSALFPPAKFSGRRTQNTDAFPAARGLVAEKQIQKISGAARATCAFLAVHGRKPFLKLEKLPNRQHAPPYRRATVGSMCFQKMVFGQKFSVGICGSARLAIKSDIERKTRFSRGRKPGVTTSFRGGHNDLFPFSRGARPRLPCSGLGVRGSCAPARRCASAGTCPTPAS